MSAGIFQRQARDLTVRVEDHHASGCFTGPESQRDIYHGVIAGLAGGRGAHAFEAANGPGHASPPVGDPVYVHVLSQYHVEFTACLLPATLDASAFWRPQSPSSLRPPQTPLRPIDVPDAIAIGPAPEGRKARLTQWPRTAARPPGWLRPRTR